MKRIVKAFTISFAVVSLMATFATAQTFRHTTPSLRPSLVFGAGFGAVSNEDPTFTAIDFPGSTGTQAWGINPSGDIVGFYTGAGVTHGFLLSGGNFTSIDFPGAASTSPSGINARGDIVGGYVDADGVTHGSLWSSEDLTFTSIDFPGAKSSEANGINDEGDIVGDYNLVNKTSCCFQGQTQGYELSGGNFTTIDVPGSTITSVSRINPRGDIVGTTFIGKPHGFTLIAGVFTTYEASPNATYTNGLGINPQGDVVGRYVFNGFHGYLLSDGQFTTIDVPGAVFTGNTAINPRGDIVGRYRTPDGVFHGFLLSRHKETFD